MSHWKYRMRNICRIANTDYSNSLVKIMMVGSYKLSFFVCAVRGQIARWFVRRAKTIFADNFSNAEIILLAKDGQAKIASRNFFGAFIRADFFSSPLCGPKNAVNFLDHDGPKKGCNPWPSAGAFSFVRREAMSKVQKRYSLVKSNRNAPLNPDFGI